MESFVQLRRGVTPERIHADVGPLKDDEMGRNGFVGRQAQFYRRGDPTAFRARGPIRDVHVPTYDVKPTDLADPAGEALLLFSNADARISISRRSKPMPFYARNIDADEVYFAHLGAGRFVTEFGTVPYRPGDYVYLPKSTTYRHVPDGEENHLLLLESFAELKVPSSRALAGTGRSTRRWSSCPRPRCSRATAVTAMRSAWRTAAITPGSPTTTIRATPRAGGATTSRSASTSTSTT
jgi:homogentisate 1,2-dioxygenase